MLALTKAHLAVVEPHGPDAPLIPGLTASTRLTSASAAKSSAPTPTRSGPDTVTR